MKPILLLVFILGLQTSLFSQTWIQKKSLPIAAQGSFSFSIGGMLYVGGGYNGTTINNFQMYNPAIDSWSTVANVPTPIEASYGFVLNGMGYMVCGSTGSALSNEVYMYNPGTDTWTQKNNFPGAARQNHVCLSANGKGYLFGGFTGGSNVVNDMWQYDDSTDTWMQMASAPGPGRETPVGLVINNKIYVGMGSTSTNTSVFSDFYLFDPLSNAYTTMDSIPVGRCDAANFTLNNLGYVGLGISAPGVYLSDFYTYDPLTNTWTQRDSFTGGARKNTYNEVVGKTPYVGGGNNGAFESDNWTYGFPDDINELNSKSAVSLSCYPSPTQEGFTIDMSGYETGEKKIDIYDQLGQIVYQTDTADSKTLFEGKLASGIYLVSVRQGELQKYVSIVIE